MFSKFQDKDRKLYAKLFIYITLIVVSVILILSTVLYFNFDKIVQNQIYSSTISNLAQTSQDTSLMVATGKALCTQVYYDQYVSKLCLYDSPNLQETSQALQQLDSYRRTSPYIDSVYVYNSKEETFFVSSDMGKNRIEPKASFYDQEIVKIIDDLKDFGTLKPIPRLIPSTETGRPGSKCYSFIFYELTQSKPYSIVVVNISELWLQRSIDGFMPSSEDNTFIINNKGILMSDSWKYSMLTNISNKEYIRRILNSPNNSDYFITDVDGEKSLVAFISSDAFGWKFARIIPSSIIFGKIDQMKLSTIVFCLIILITGLSIYFFLSQRFYKRVDSMLSKLETLEAEKRESFYTLRQDFMKTIVKNPQLQDLDMVQEKMRSLNIDLDVYGKYFLLLLKIDRNARFINMYSTKDRNLFKFSILNIATEVCSASFKVEGMDMDDDSMVVLLNGAIHSGQTSMEDIESMTKKIQIMVADHLSISVSIFISPTGNTIQTANSLYGKTLDASLYRLIFGYSCIIFSEKIADRDMHNYNYPYPVEKQLVDALILGKADEAKNSFIEIIQGAIQYSYPVINMTISRLLFAVSMAVDMLQKNGFTMTQFNTNEFFISLNGVEILEDIQNSFFKLFDTIAQDVEEKRSTRNEDMVQKIITTIQKEYANPNLCLESIADSLGMTPAHIGRLFKKYTSTTILEYVMETKMNKAKELLTGTDLSAVEVADKTGFSSSSYFFKVFKKMNGVTPNEFRRLTTYTEN